MKIPKITDAVKKIAGFLLKSNVEKVVLKTLIAVWVVTLLVIAGLKAVKSNRDDIEKKISEMATNMRIAPSVTCEEMQRYEGILDQAECPTPKSAYASGVERDPFSKNVPASAAAVPAAVHDFVLDSIGNVPLPVMYKGFIEMPDKLIGQISWRNTTKFVEDGGVLNGYKIQRVAKDRIEAMDEQGRKVDFMLNKPVLSDKPGAVLYDNISKKTFNVEMASVIDDYKVIDIQPDYVILLLGGSEIKLTK